MDSVIHIDGNTQLEFLERDKTIIVIDKDRFLVCKQLTLEQAPDEDFANFLNIPLEKVRYFKYKMQLFEDAIRARRRAAKLEKRRHKKEPVRKREISSEERFRRARDLISRNYSTNQISKILKVSERSVTRFKRRMREEKQRLKAEGKIATDPNDPDDEGSFRHLKPEEKMKTAQELFRKRLKIQEISEILKVSERTVRRWKDKLSKLKDETENSLQEGDENEAIEEVQEAPKRPVRIKKVKMETLEDDVEDDVEDEDFHEDSEITPAARKKRRLYVDREKVQYARELIENKLSNKEMSMLLEMSIACVRKLKMKILNGTVDELIDNSAEHYTKLGKVKEEAASSGVVKIDPDTDPLNFMESNYYTPTASTSANSFGYERKPKVVLRDREMFLARLLRENNVRTMDIAKMMKISERSVTRLLAKSRELEVIEYEADVVAEVDRLLAEKDEILNAEMMIEETEVDQAENDPQAGKDDSKRQICSSLLAMNVKLKDIAKMLDVSEKTIQRWKAKIVKHQQHEGSEDEAAGHSVFRNLLPKQETEDLEEYGDYE